MTSLPPSRSQVEKAHELSILIEKSFSELVPNIPYHSIIKISTQINSLVSQYESLTNQKYKRTYQKGDDSRFRALQSSSLMKILGLSAIVLGGLTSCENLPKKTEDRSYQYKYDSDGDIIKAIPAYQRK